VSVLDAGYAQLCLAQYPPCDRLVNQSDQRMRRISDLNVLSSSCMLA